MSKLILVTYSEPPVSGYFDGDAKTQFTWTLGRVNSDERGEFQRIHGWEANFWFHVSKGKNDKATLVNALRSLKARKMPISRYEYIIEN